MPRIDYGDWDYELLQDLAKLCRPDKTDIYHSLENVKKGYDSPAVIIQRNVRMFLKNLSPETFLNTEVIGENKNELETSL